MVSDIKLCIYLTLNSADSAAETNINKKYIKRENEKEKKILRFFFSFRLLKRKTMKIWISLSCLFHYVFWCVKCVFHFYLFYSFATTRVCPRLLYLLTLLYRMYGITSAQKSEP